MTVGAFGSAAFLFHGPVALRVFLSKINVDDAVDAQITQRSVAEGFRLPGEIVNRINYVFEGSVVGDP